MTTAPAINPASNPPYLARVYNWQIRRSGNGLVVIGTAVTAGPGRTIVDPKFKMTCKSVALHKPSSAHPAYLAAFSDDGEPVCILSPDYMIGFA